MDYPAKVWLANNEYGLFVNQKELTGETSRSWVAGPVWASTNFPKYKYRIVSESEAQEILWAAANRYHIGYAVSNSQRPDELRKIARMIGYVEQETDGKSTKSY